MPQVYDNFNERVKITITPEDHIEVLVGAHTMFVLEVPTAEDLLEGLTKAVEHVKMKRKSTDGY